MRTNLKRFVSRLFLIFAALAVAGVTGSHRFDTAKAADSAGEETPNYNASGSIVQVVILYQDENTNYHIIQSGSGVLLDEKTVVTNRHLIVLSEENKTAAGEYLSELLGQTISFIPPEEGHGEVASYQVAVVIEADIYNMATSTFSSADWDVATLTLSSPMSKEYAVLGDSDQIESGKLVSVLGFPNSSCTEPRSFQLGDLMITEGVCSDREGGNINHTAVMQRGNTGGALVDEYGRVVGIATYSGNEAGIYSALPINQIKAYLSRDGVAYREDMADYDAVAEEKTATETDSGNVHTTVKTDLYRTLQEAKIICEGGNDGLYTEESFRELQVEYDVAQNIYDDERAEQKLIDEETEILRGKIDGLEKIKKTDVAFIVTIVVSSVALVVLITILIILCVRKGKTKKDKEEEKQRIKTIGGNADRNSDEYAGPYQSSVSAIKGAQNIGLPSSQLYARFDAKTNVNRNNVPVNYGGNAGTTVLQSGSGEGEGTTVLNSFVQEPVRAFLYRSSTGENVSITGESFVIGKNSEGVDYTVDGNTGISRRHAMLTRQYEEYYIEDLHSTNSTYVNGVRVMPGNKQLLETNDVIYLADEEFIFMKNG